MYVKSLLKEMEQMGRTLFFSPQGEGCMLLAVCFKTYEGMRVLGRQCLLTPHNCLRIKTEAGSWGWGNKTKQYK